MAVSLCTVSFNVKIGNTAVQGALCKAQLAGRDQAHSDGVLSNREVSATTDASGDATLSLVQRGSFTKGSGLYRIWVEISGKTIASITTTIPNQSAIDFDDLVKA